MRDNLFCPLIKQECKKDECVMWKPEACLISVYLIRNIISSAMIESENKPVEVNSNLANQLFEGYAVALDNSGEQDAQNSEWEAIFSKSADEFADEIIQFAKNENLMGDDESYLPREIDDLFWSSKGLEISNKEIPLKYRSIRKKAWLISSSKLKKEAKPTRISWLDRDSGNDEKAISSLPNELLAEQLITFAKESGLGQDDYEVLSRDILEMFWKSKGIQRPYDVSPEVGIKIKQVEKLARDNIQQKVFSASNDELAQELAGYAKKKAGRENGQGVYVSSASHTFWRSKGLDYRIDSLELQQRKDEVERLAQEIIDKDFHEYRDKRIEAEKVELPKLIQSCVDWARNSGRNSVTIKDVEYFLLENKVDILEATERALYLSANNELKTRKRAS